MKAMGSFAYVFIKPE